MIDNVYLSRAIKNAISPKLWEDGIKRYNIMDIHEETRVGGYSGVGKGEYWVLAKHRMMKDSCEKDSYNCTMFSIQAFTDWTLSEPVKSATFMYADGVFKYGNLKDKNIRPDCLMSWILSIKMC